MSAISLQGNAGGTGTLTVAAPSTNTNRTLTLPDGTGTFSVAGVNSNIVSGTAQNSTSGTSIDFTGIPSWVKRITVMFAGISTNGTGNIQIQIGSGSYVISSYTSQSWAATSTGLITTGLVVTNTTAAFAWTGTTVLTLIDTNKWVSTSLSSYASGTSAGTQSGGVSPVLSGALDRLRIIGSATGSPSDTFDNGQINILYE